MVSSFLQLVLDHTFLFLEYDKEDITINADHFEKALKNTCVLSLENVHLYSPGSKNFSDIGGLLNLKKILVESLLWPAQVGVISPILA